jgi:hypothetical protein
MAKVKYNVVTHGITGKVGDLLQFSQRFGKTIIGKIAARSNKVTEEQALVREKFRQAAAYAKSAIDDPGLKEVYNLRAVGDISAYNLAFKDFFVPPTVTAVNTSAYDGSIGSPITITATDDTKVVEVKVQIFDSNANMLEEGSATQQVDGDTWIYTASTFNNNLSDGRIMVVARDMPGNSGTNQALL